MPIVSHKLIDIYRLIDISSTGLILKLNIMLGSNKLTADAASCSLDLKVDLQKQSLGKAGVINLYQRGICCQMIGS